MSKKKFVLALAFLAPAACSPEPTDSTAIARPATAAAVWTPWISEEFGGPAECPTGMTTIGVACNGAFCDQVRLRCDRFTTTLGSASWTDWVETGGDIFGNNTKKDAVCADKEWMTGIDCRGEFCDDVKVECRSSNKEAINCFWTELYSEEQAPYTAPNDWYLRGVHCEGQHCDNKRYYVCQTRPEPASSCRNRCGSDSTGHTCWCDDACTNYHDCCADFSSTCHP